MELLPLNDSTQLIIIKKPQETKRQLAQNTLEINLEQLDKQIRFFLWLKQLASTEDDDVIIIKRKKKEPSPPADCSNEIKEAADEPSTAPVKEADDKVVKPVHVNFKCRRNKQAFVEMVLREVDKKIGLFKTPVSDLIKLLFSKNVLPDSLQIHLECKNPVFAYVFKKLEINFESLNFRNIGRSKRFYSENGKPLKDYALYKAWSRTRFDPPNANQIDRIFKKVEQICTDI